MARHMVEIKQGVGSLYGGGLRLRDVPYRLFRWADDDASATPVIGPLEGTVDIEGIGEATVLAGVDDLVLQLADGRRISIALTSSTGHIIARGAEVD